MLMKGRSIKIAASFLLILAVLIACAAGVLADDYPLREGDITSPRSGNVIAAVEGKFVPVTAADKTTILNRINAIRKEACDEGVPNPGNRSVKLKSSDYSPLKWSKLLEMVSAMRATESSIHLGHGRLAKDHTSVFENGYGVGVYCENLAWNSETETVGSILYAIEQWYSEKSIWVKGSTGQTGHYTSLINPNYTQLGIAGFRNDEGRYRMTIACHLTYDTGLNESVAGIGGSFAQKTEMNPALITSLSISGASDFIVGGSASLSARGRYKDTADLGTSYGVGPVCTGITWTSSDTSVAKVDSKGVVTGVSAGTAKITAKVGSVSASYNVKVGAPPVLTAKSGGYNSVELSWTATGGAAGYTLMRSDSANGPFATLTNTSSLKYTDKGLTTGKTYYYKIKAYTKQNGSTVYGPDSKMVSCVPDYLEGWNYIGGKWYYYKNKTKVTGWVKDGSKWYYMDSTGVMQTGKLTINGKQYLFGSSGEMFTGWKSEGGKWYYYGSSGAMQTGWGKVGGKWYYFNKYGVMQTGWLRVDGKWYYFNSSGAMLTGWQKMNGNWYFFSSSGAMQTGWQKIGSSWYYFDNSGVMAAGEWVGDYYLQSDGKMATNKWIGKYYVGADGKWVKNKKK